MTRHKSMDISNFAFLIIVFYLYNLQISIKNSDFIHKELKTVVLLDTVSSVTLQCVLMYVWCRFTCPWVNVFKCRSSGHMLTSSWYPMVQSIMRHTTHFFLFLVSKCLFLFIISQIVLIKNSKEYW